MENVYREFARNHPLLKDVEPPVTQRSNTRVRPGFDPLGEVLFILGDFPEKTQTFIHREMCEMHRRGHAVNVLAINEIARNDLDDSLLGVLNNTLFIKKLPETRSVRVPCGFPSWSTRRRLTRQALALPHRSVYHRFRFLTALAVAVRVAGMVQARGYRYIHAHFASFQTEIAMCLSWITGIPYGITSHAYDLWRDRNLLHEKIAGAKIVLTCTECNLKQLRTYAGDCPEKIMLVRHGIDLEEWRRDDTRRPNTSNEWLAIGRLIPKKGFVHLVEAMSILRKQGVSAQLTIIGDGPERGRLTAQIRALGLTDSVRMAGALSNRKVRDRLMQARGLAVPSIATQDGDMDGIPNVIIEAMALGKPVIGTKISGIPEIVRNDVNGLLVNPADASSLALAMMRLICDPESAMRLGLEGRKTVERDYDIRRSVDNQLRCIAGAVVD